MLKKIYKLNSFEIKGFFSQNMFTVKVYRNEYFDIKIFNFKDNLEILEKSLKFAVIISSKTFKQAVIRNKIKRQVYSLIENYLKIKNPKNTNLAGILIYPKKSIKEIKFLDLQEKVYNIFNNFIK